MRYVVLFKYVDDQRLVVAGNLSSPEVRAYKADGYRVDQWDSIPFKSHKKPQRQRPVYNRFGIRVVS